MTGHPVAARLGGAPKHLRCCQNFITSLKQSFRVIPLLNNLDVKRSPGPTRSHETKVDSKELRAAVVCFSGLVSVLARRSVTSSTLKWTKLASCCADRLQDERRIHA